MILAIRTDKPEAELHLLDAQGVSIASHVWEAHRTLAATLVDKIGEFLHGHGTSTAELSGFIIFTGAGSFTGLRIGTTVANALAYAHSIPVVAAEGQDWIEGGVKRLATAQPGQYVAPTYDREPNITQPK